MMVSDSKCSIASKGISYPTIKIIRAKNNIAGAAGSGGDCTRFLNWAKVDFKGPEPKWGSETTNTTEDGVLGLVLNDKGIHIWCYGDPEPERIEADFFAIGSGGRAARMAMLLGKTPIEAVELACQVDEMNSGLPLQILKLGD